MPGPEQSPGTDLLSWLLAPAGLVLVGAGVSISTDAALRRAAGASARRWVAQGTLGLVVLNSGLSVFGDSVRRRADGRRVGPSAPPGRGRARPAGRTG